MAVEPENQEYGLDKGGEAGEAGEVSSILVDLQNLKLNK